VKTVVREGFGVSGYVLHELRSIVHFLFTAGISLSDFDSAPRTVARRISTETNSQQLAALNLQGW